MYDPIAGPAREFALIIQPVGTLQNLVVAPADRLRQTRVEIVRELDTHFRLKDKIDKRGTEPWWPWRTRFRFSRPISRSKEQTI